MEYNIASKLMQKWDIRFCELAKYISGWSKDPNAQVGAVLFSKKGGNISIGYNGFPMGVEDSVERLTDKDTKLELVVHAEVNALIAAGSRAEGSTVYVWGKPICARCAGPIIQAGVKRVVALAPGDTESQWDKSGKSAHQMFIEAGIVVDFYTVNESCEKSAEPIGPPDAAPSPPDAAPSPPDAAPSPRDAAPSPPDAAPSPPDAAPSPPDAAPSPPDAAP